jgi:L-threonylcarbamoyladenylate synthase
MEAILVTDSGAVAKAVAVLRAGGVILYPTDTLYGLGADALSDEALAKVRAIKGREEGKPIHAIVASLEMAAEYGEVNEMALALASAYMPGPLTLILRKHPEAVIAMCKGRDEFGFRMPDTQFCLELAREFGRPYTTTSANLAGEKPERSPEKILAQLGDRAERIDLVIDAGELPECAPSTVVDISSGTMQILRKGAVLAE